MLLIVFVGLQLLDVLSTLVFLHQGVAEANPIVRAALSVSRSPAVALILLKIGGSILAATCWFSGRRRLLKKVNFVYVGCVLWNITAVMIA